MMFLQVGCVLCVSSDYFRMLHLFALRRYGLGRSLKPDKVSIAVVVCV